MGVSAYIDSYGACAVTGEPAVHATILLYAHHSSYRFHYCHSVPRVRATVEAPGIWGFFIRALLSVVYYCIDSAYGNVQSHI